MLGPPRPESEAPCPRGGRLVGHQPLSGCFSEREMSPQGKQLKQFGIRIWSNNYSRFLILEQASSDVARGCMTGTAPFQRTAGDIFHHIQDGSWVLPRIEPRLSTARQGIFKGPLSHSRFSNQWGARVTSHTGSPLSHAIKYTGRCADRSGFKVPCGPRICQKIHKQTHLLHTQAGI